MHVFDKTGKGLRWWPAAIIIALSILAIAYIWLSDNPNRQNQVQQTGQVVIVAILVMLLWLLFFSRLRWKIRLTSFAAIILFLAALAALFRVRGVSGDVIPVLEWRWAEQPLKPLAEGSTDVPILIPAKVDDDPWFAPNNYPQFLGPNRDAKKHGIRLARDWSKHPPRLLWRQPIGAGWSAFAVVGNAAITQEQRGEQEMVVCYDLMSGQVKWSHSDNTGYKSAVTGDGPRATPTIVRDRVYTLGGTGILNCLELATGERIWSKNIFTDNNGKMNQWGASCSPLVLDSLVVVSAGRSNGRSLVAYHKETGEIVWSGGSDPAGYSSPLITTLGDQPQILIFNRGNVVAHDPRTGEILWQHPWPDESECVAQPVPLPGDRVFVSSGYGIGCKLFQIQRNEQNHWRASLIWETNRLKAKFTNVVYRDGYIYGLDDGILVCLDLTNGERKWKRGRYGHGQVILVDDLLLVQAEKGDVVLVEANPNAHKELARFAALDSKTWNNPALAGPYLLVRNDREAACYELPVNQ
jgi:outer membrane protein assembly factor BamB